MSWWFAKAERALEELNGLKELADQTPWLSMPSGPTIKGLDLAQDFDIHWMGEDYPLVLIYPQFFPDVPARIVHREGKRISIHQYGKAGELCLRHRAENWNPSVTGRSMVEDAFALISGEHPEDGSKGYVPCADLLTQGQEHMKAWARFVQPFSIAEAVPELAPFETRPIRLLTSKSGKVFTLRIKALERDADGEWISLTQTLRSDQERDGFLINLAGQLEVETLSSDELISSIQDRREHYGLPPLSSDEVADYLVDTHGPEWAAYFKLKNEDPLLAYTTLLASPPSQRLPSLYKNLGDKNVALVGCGSLGSKVALSLARSGVRRFTFIDDDIFHEDNTVRNALDNAAVGLHKVDALKAAIERLPGDYVFVCKRAGIGRQGSANNTNILMEALGEADLIMDLTASARAFNYTASVSTRREIPFIGASVFAGGIGGMVFRARPKIDPTPAQAKAQIKQWKAKQGVPWETEGEEDPYTYTLDEEVIIATDADVSVMAGYATQMALDLLGDAPKTTYPHSAYAIGFQDKWIFNQPFQVFPIGLEAEGLWGASVDTTEADLQANLVAFTEILERIGGKDAA